MIRAVIFDVDGVLADSEVIFLKSTSRFLRKNGIEKDFRELAFLVGQSMEKIAADLLTLDNIKGRYTPEQIRSEIYGAYPDIIGSEGMPKIEGLEEFLAYLKRRKIHTAVATSGDVEHMNEMLDGVGLEHEFDIIVTIEKVARSKPFPDLYLECAKELNTLGVKKEEILVIEDSPNGINAAKAAGLFTVGLKASLIQQDTSKADMESASFQDIMKYIEKEETI
ncbi:MAG: HAD family phosphatase [Erysipelotrichaceae bacterium]|nr:HAD family phosphatase [Erysipelotrichaceae bacterium]